MSIREELKKIKCGKKELREFGVTMGAVLAIIAGVVWLKTRNVNLIVLGAGAAFAAFGLVAPLILKPLYQIWMPFAVLVGWVMTRVILTAAFYVILTPLSLIARLFGANFLDMKRSKDKASYWIQRGQLPFDKTRYEKQF